MDYYSSFGPTWHDYNLKPQVSAPEGHILSTWPLGPLGGYAILSGISMATPYLAASYALVKTQFPKASIAEITTRLQINAKPLPWIWNSNKLSATYRQGAGLVDVFNAIYSDSTIQKHTALKTVHLPKCEEHQNRYVQKFTPNLNGMPDTLQKCFM
jgi:subtilisin family serine protease